MRPMTGPATGLLCHMPFHVSLWGGMIATPFQIVLGGRRRDRPPGDTVF